MSEATTETASNGSPPPALATPTRAEQLASALAKAADKAKAAIPKPEGAANDGAAEAKPGDAEKKPDAKADEVNEHELLKRFREVVGNDPANLKVMKDLLAMKNPTNAFVAIKQRNKELAKREREIEAKREAYERDAAEIKELLELRKTKPLDFVNRAGVKIRELAEQEASSEPEWKQALTAAERRIEALQAKLEEKDKREEQTAAERQASEQQQRDEYVTGDIQRRWGEELGEKYEYLHGFEPEHIARTAWKMLQDHYAEHDEALDLSVALDRLELEAKSLHERLSRSKERRRPGEKGQEPSERGNGAGKSAKPAAASDPPATLSNADVADRGSPPEKPKTPADYRKRAHLLAERRAAATKQ